MAILVASPCAFQGLKTFSQYVDDIWYYSGDRSIDMSWYTKRAMLASIYLLTELYMMRDKSAGFVDTYAFLDRKFEDIKHFGMWKSELTNMAEACLKTVQGIMDPVR
jgi:ubiquinone biosynthesis protein COQ9